MSKLTSLIRRAPRRFSAVVAMIAVAVIVPAAVFAWGPSRETFTLAHPSDHVQFDSITDNPNIGDERNFVGIRDASSTSNVWSDNMTAQPGKEYYVRMYVHNNAATNLNLVAQNVTAKFNLPTSTGKSIQVDGFIDASNVGADTKGNKGAFGEVYDSATFNSTQNFNLAYEAGSLKYENNAFGPNGTPLPESIFTSAGAKLGYDKLDGNIPGCFQYSGYVTFKVKPQFAQTTNFTLSKLVSKHGANDWKETYAAQPGETVDFILAYKNTGEVQHDDVTFRDTLPTGLSYVAGTNTWSNARTQNVPVATSNLTNGTGINVGSYTPGANAFTVFSAKVAAADQLKCGENSLVNKGKVNTGGYAVEDTATVTVNRTCAPVVKYTCDALSVNVLSRTEFQFSTKYTVQNATFKSVTYTIKNAAGKVVDTKTTSAAAYKYTQTTAGKYTVQATVTVTVAGKDQTVTSANCKGAFEVPATPGNITVCELATKKIVTIKESDFNTTKYSKNLDDCKTPITVCDLSTKTVVTIDQANFDASKYSKDLSLCSTPTTPPTTPPELPHTGATENIVAVIGLGALVAGVSYYIASRRALGL